MNHYESLPDGMLAAKLLGGPDEGEATLFVSEQHVRDGFIKLTRVEPPEITDFTGPMKAPRLPDQFIGYLYKSIHGVLLCSPFKPRKTHE